MRDDPKRSTTLTHHRPIVSLDMERQTTYVFCVVNSYRRVHNQHDSTGYSRGCRPSWHRQRINRSTLSSGLVSRSRSYTSHSDPRLTPSACGGLRIKGPPLSASETAIIKGRTGSFVYARRTKD